MHRNIIFYLHLSSNPPPPQTQYIFIAASTKHFTHEDSIFFDKSSILAQNLAEFIVGL
jgi:hypothetical protein